MSINELTSLEAGMFGNLTSLDMLSLHSNPLTKIDSSVFAHPVNLEKLELPPSTEVPGSSSDSSCSDHHAPRRGGHSPITVRSLYTLAPPGRSRARWHRNPW